jgi:CysZ protein
MTALIYSLFRALRSLFAPGMFSVMLMSVLFTILMLFGFIGLCGILSDIIASHAQNPAVAHFLPYAGSIGATFIAWFLFPGIMPVIISFFDNRIVTLIEREDYPNVPVMSPPAFWPEFWHDVRFSLMVIALNIIVLPLYIVPVVNIFLFYVLNGYLLGREFFVMVGRRHTPTYLAEEFRRRHSRAVTIAGMLLTVAATIPIVNLFAPFWGIAVMTHLYHRLSGTPIRQIS